jgi:beta-galactosidase/beta-glucuronidase
MATEFRADAQDGKSHKFQADQRPGAAGKFLFVGSDKFFIKGVTYGAFRPDDAGLEFQDTAQIRRDFALMSENGFNTVRIPHTTPPPHLMDIAAEHNLRVMVGLSAEQYVGQLVDGRKRPAEAFADIRSKMRLVNGHPALLSYALGNEIPAAVARWLGRDRIETYLSDLYKVV